MSRLIERDRHDSAAALRHMPHRAPRVAQVIPSLQVGGLQKIVVRLVDHFQSRMDHLVVTPSGDGPLRTRFSTGVPVRPLADPRRSGKWNAVRMARLFRAYRPDVVHTRNWTCLDAIIGARLAGVPVVIHGEHGREASDPEGSNAFRRRVRRLLAPLVTEFVTVSRDLARWLASDVGIPPAKITQIYNGVDTEAFSPGDRHEAREGLGLPHDPIVMGTVGRLDPVKDHRGLIEAFHRLASRRDTRLLIVGDGPCRPELERLTNQLGLRGRVHLLGERDDINVMLRALDVFILPSLGEGISNAILEAMATGLPVVATRVGGNPELVDDGVTGFLVPSGSTNSLTAALLRYLDDPGLMRHHGDAGRTRTLNEFSLSRMFAAYDALYARVLAKVSPR
jgi:sugar transferase (PEP-CTERM/EpsH1 system associated)